MVAMPLDIPSITWGLDRNPDGREKISTCWLTEVQGSARESGHCLQASRGGGRPLRKHSEEYYQCIFLIEVLVMQMICYVFVSRCHAQCIKKRYLISKSNDNRRERALENLFVTKPDPLDTNIQRNVWKHSCRKTYKVWFCESDVFQWRRKQPTFLVGDLTNNLLKGLKINI